MANNPQPPAIAAAVFDAVGVWVTELPITPERVLRALEAKADGGEPRREGKTVVFDEELSVNARLDGGMHVRGARLMATRPSGRWNGSSPTPSSRAWGSTPSAASR